MNHASNFPVDGVLTTYTIILTLQGNALFVHEITGSVI